MLARELAEKLLETPDVEVTVSVWDGDWSEENEIDTVINWDSYVSILHSRKN